MYIGSIGVLVENDKRKLYVKLPCPARLPLQPAEALPYSLAACKCSCHTANGSERRAVLRGRLR